MAQIEYRLLPAASTDEARELCRRYWELGQSGRFVHSVAAIADAFGLPKARVAEHVRYYCVALYGDQCCQECERPRLIASRAEYATLLSSAPKSWTCDSCAEQAAAERLEREKADADARKEQERLATVERVARVSEALATRRANNPLTLQRLSFSDAVFLLAVIRAGASDDLSFIYPLTAFRHQLSPTAELDLTILQQLAKRGLLAVHPGSTAASIVMREGQFDAYYQDRVHWVLPLPESGPSPAKFAEMLEAELTPPHVDAWDPQEVAALQRQVALHECLAFVCQCMMEHHYEPNIGEKMQLVLRSALRLFSVGQVYVFIWRATKDAAAYQVREGISSTHAANIIPGAIQRQAERATTDRWEVKPFRRRPENPESTLTHVLFTLSLGLPDGGFCTVQPSEPPPD